MTPDEGLPTELRPLKMSTSCRMLEMLRVNQI